MVGGGFLSYSLSIRLIPPYKCTIHSFDLLRSAKADRRTIGLLPEAEEAAVRGKGRKRGRAVGSGEGAGMNGLVGRGFLSYSLSIRLISPTITIRFVDGSRPGGGLLSWSLFARLIVPTTFGSTESRPGDRSYNIQLLEGVL